MKEEKFFDLGFDYRDGFALIPQTLFSESLAQGNNPYLITLAYNTGYSKVEKPIHQWEKPKVAPYVSFELARDTLKRFHCRLDRELIGARFNSKNPFLYRTFFLAVLESHALKNRDSGQAVSWNTVGYAAGDAYRSTCPHWHLIAIPPLLKAPKSFQSQVRKAWKETWSKGRGSVDVQQICTSKDLKTVSGYVAKHIHHSSNNERWLLSTDFVNPSLLDKHSIASLVQSHHTAQ